MTSVAKQTSNTVVKAGKKKQYTEPMKPNQAKKEAREAGLKQFMSPTQLTVPGTKVVFNKNTQQFETKLVAVPVPFLWDSDRKHFVYSPRKDLNDD